MLFITVHIARCLKPLIVVWKWGRPRSSPSCLILNIILHMCIFLHSKTYQQLHLYGVLFIYSVIDSILLTSTSRICQLYWMFTITGESCKQISAFPLALSGRPVTLSQLAYALGEETNITYVNIKLCHGISNGSGIFRWQLKRVRCKNVHYLFFLWKIIKFVIRCKQWYSCVNSA